MGSEREGQTQDEERQVKETDRLLGGGLAVAWRCAVHQGSPAFAAFIAVCTTLFANNQITWPALCSTGRVQVFTEENRVAGAAGLPRTPVWSEESDRVRPVRISLLCAQLDKEDTCLMRHCGYATAATAVPRQCFGAALRSQLVVTTRISAAAWNRGTARGTRQHRGRLFAGLFDSRRMLDFSVCFSRVPAGARSAVRSWIDAAAGFPLSDMFKWAFPHKGPSQLKGAH